MAKKMKYFRTGDTANGQETSEEIIEAESELEALRELIDNCNLYCEEIDKDEAEEIKKEQ